MTVKGLASPVLKITVYFPGLSGGTGLTGGTGLSVGATLSRGGTPIPAGLEQAGITHAASAISAAGTVSFRKVFFIIFYP
jgi:hypothetical protein